MRWFVIVMLVNLWNVTLHAQSSSPFLEYGRGLPRHVMWSPQGEQLIVVTHNGVLWQYDARTLTTIDHIPQITSAHYADSGAWLLTQNLKGIWAIRSADDPHELIAEGFSALWSAPNTAWLMTRDSSGLALRSDSDPRQVALAGLDDVFFSPHHQHILTHDSVNGYVLRDSKLSPLPHQPQFPSRATNVQWSPDGQRLALVTDAHQVSIVPLSIHQAPYQLQLPDRERFSALVWSPDSTRFLSYDAMGNAQIWDADNGQRLLDLSSGDPYRTPQALDDDPYVTPNYWNLSWSSDGSHLFRCVSYGGDVSIACKFYDAKTGIQVGQGVKDGGLHLDPTRRYFILSEGVYDAATGQLIAPFEENINALNAVFSATTNSVVLASMWTSHMSVYNLKTFRLEYTLQPMPYLYDPFSIAWSPDGQQFITWGSNRINGSLASGLITLWDAEHGTEIGRITEHVLFGQTMAFSSDSPKLASADNLGNIALFDLVNGDRLAPLSGHLERVSQMAWQPHSTLLASTTGRTSDYTSTNLAVDGALVHIWDTRTSQLVATLEHEQAVLAVLWHPSGRYLITDDLGGMSIWDAQTWARERIPEMAGDTYSIPPSYRWTAEGDVLIRGYYNCTHGGGPSLNFLHFVTHQHVGPIHCSGDYAYEWLDALGGTLLPRPNCAYTSDLGNHDCQVEVVFISTELANALYEDESPSSLAPSYQFGQFEQEISLFPSPDTAQVAILSATEIQVWQLGLKQASLLWHDDRSVKQLAWNHSGTALALAHEGSISITAADSGTSQVSLNSLELSDLESIYWSADDRYLWVSIPSAQYGGWVFDVVDGRQIVLPEDASIQRWRHSVLELYRSDSDSYEWWNVGNGQVKAANPTPLTVFSADGRFAADMNTGIMRVWQLGE